MLRPGEPADAPTLRALQSHLADPSPALLEHGLRTGTVLVDAGGPAPNGEANAETEPRVTDADSSATPTATESAPTTEPVGYVLPVGYPDPHVAELVVAPASRREGRGRRLLAAVLDRAAGEVTLLVAVDNEPARALYDSLGFRVRRTRPDFYADGTDALLMVRSGRRGRSDEE